MIQYSWDQIRIQKDSSGSTVDDEAINQIKQVCLCVCDFCFLPELIFCVFFSAEEILYFIP